MRSVRKDPHGEEFPEWLRRTYKNKKKKKLCVCKSEKGEKHQRVFVDRENPEERKGCCSDAKGAGSSAHTCGMKAILIKLQSYDFLRYFAASLRFIARNWYRGYPERMSPPSRAQGRGGVTFFPAATQGNR